MSQDLAPIVPGLGGCPRTSHGQLHDPGLARLHGPALSASWPSFEPRVHNGCAPCPGASGSSCIRASGGATAACPRTSSAS
eukprot:2619366-Alexandrium_andersonii.AAC.1